jgi:hypothetical protein
MSYHRNLSFITSGILILVFATLACSAVPGLRGIKLKPPEIFQPVCTPPSCARNAAYTCQGECPGGCGTYCRSFTPAPQMMYTTVELVETNFENSILDITLQVPGIEGDFYGVIYREEFACQMRRSDNLELLSCRGRIWSDDSEQELRIYRSSDDMQAITINIDIP